MTPPPPHRFATQAARLMAVEMMSNLLATANPRDISRRLTEELRELTGAHTVLLIVHRGESGAHELLSACPERRASLFRPEELGLVCPDRDPSPLPRRTKEFPRGHPLIPVLARSKVESIIRIPLQSAGEPVGALLALDLPDPDRSDEAADVMTLMAPAVALSLRNALVLEQVEAQKQQVQRYASELESRVKERTSELASLNEDLVASRLGALNMMEDAVEARRRAEETAAALRREAQERAQADQALRESEERFRSLVEQAGDGFELLDSEGRYVDANSATLRQLGYTREELLQLNICDIDPLLSPEKYESQFRALTGQPHMTFESVHRRKDGSTFPVEITASILRIGGHLRSVALARDITERKVAEATLRASEERFRTLVESAPEAILVQSELKFVYLNRSASKLFGADAPEQLIGQSVLERVATSYRDLVAKRMSTLADRGAVPPLELQCVRLDGTPVEVEATPVAMVYGGRNCILSFLRDMTEHKRLEEKLREAQKMEAIGQLAGGVAHDFNNILAATMMNLSLLEQNDSLDQEIREGLKELEADAQRAAALTRQLLMFSRRSVLEVKVLDLNEVIANLLKMVGRLIGEHIELQLHRKTVLPKVEADAGMLEQVLMNLSVNARDAMPKGGRIVITTEAREIDEEDARMNPDRRPGHFVCLSVADTGCGMDSITLKRIFEPFFTTKEAGKGTGLGLPTVYGIAAQHRGWVEVESELGAGTTFRVFLPASDRGETSEEEVAKAPAAKGHETILLVEDEFNVRRLAAQVLRVLGYRVLEAGNGREAMQIWKTHARQIDLLLTDLVMPEGIMGLDLVEKLRAERPNLKIIISSGYSADMTGQGKSTAEGIIYLPKPYELGILGHTVRQCLDQK